MKFIGRNRELTALEQARQGAVRGPSRMTVVTGRRRVGKTALILKSLSDKPFVYLFVSISSEADLCAGFVAQIRHALGNGIFIPSSIRRFSELFEVLLAYSKKIHFTLVIDEFQNFLKIAPSVYGQIQDLWDRFKDDSHMHLILSGSSHSLMHRIFEDAHEPLFGRATTKIRLQPFPPSSLKEILAQENPQWLPDDLLAFFTFTGGVPFYVADFIDNGAVTKTQMVERLLAPTSLYLPEGRDLVRLEIGAGQAIYFSILQALAAGETKAAVIADRIGVANLNPYLERLQEYGFITKQRPILSKPGAKNVRWQLKDPFLRFWFRFVHPYAALVEAGRSEEIGEIVFRHFATYSGHLLEEWFRASLMEASDWQEVGSWWQAQRGAGGAQDEIDIVALNFEEHKAFVAEVKRQQKSFEAKKFLTKVEHLKCAALSNWQITTGVLTLKDM